MSMRDWRNNEIKLYSRVCWVTRRGSSLTMHVGHVTEIGHDWMRVQPEEDSIHGRVIMAREVRLTQRENVLLMTSW